MNRNAFLALTAYFSFLGAASAQAPDAKPDAVVAPPPTPAPVVDVTTAPVVPIGEPGGSEGRGGWHVTSDVGFYILQPEWRTNPAYNIAHSTTVFNNNGNAFTGTSQTQEFGFNTQVAPRISLGLASDGGLGVRMNWWQFSESAAQSVSKLHQPALPSATLEGNASNFLLSAGPLGNFVANDASIGDIEADTNPSTTNAQFMGRLRLVVWDLEVTDEIKAGRWTLTPSAGIRYAHISQSYDANSLQIFPASTDTAGASSTQYLRSSHTFNGAGPTVSLDAQRSLGSSGISLYATPRASLLVGKTKQSSFYQSKQIFNSGTGGAPDIETANFAPTDSSDFTVIPVAEIEAGVRFERSLGRARLTAEAGVVGQAWFGAGNSSRTTSIPNFLSEEGGSGSGTVDNDLGFIGFTLRAGVSY